MTEPGPILYAEDDERDIELTLGALAQLNLANRIKELGLFWAIIEDYLVSLSEAGAFLATDEPIPVGERLALRVSLPWQMGEIRADAEVI